MQSLAVRNDMRSLKRRSTCDRPEHQTCTVRRRCFPLLWSIAIQTLIVSTINASTYYVDSVSGNDNNTGTLLPWKTFANANKTPFKPGDQLLLKAGGMWNETLIIRSSGTAGQPITIGQYSIGPAPLLDEQGIRWPAVDLTGVSYVTVTGLAMQNASNVTVYIHDSSNIIVQGCTLKNSASHAINVDGTSPNVSVLGNTYSMDPTFAMYGTFIYAMSLVESFTATDNIATLNDNSSNNGIIVVDVDNAVIARNTVYSGTQAIGVKGYTRTVSGIQIYGNALYKTSNVHGDGEVIELTGDASAGTQVQASVHHNFVSAGSNTESGIAGVYASGSSIYNNILLGPAINSGVHFTSNSLGVAVYGNDVYNFPYGVMVDSNSSANIMNNIIVGASSHAIGVGSSAHATEDYNIVFQSAPISGLNQGVNSKAANPMFVSPTPTSASDFRLQPGSPAIYTGAQFSTPYDVALDPAGQSWSATVSQNTSGGWSRGAFAFLSSTQGGSGPTSVDQSSAETRPQVVVEPAVLTFAAAAGNGSGAVQTISLSNPSSLPVSLGVITLSGSQDFSIASTTCGVVLDAGGRCVVSVMFAPATGDLDSATLSFTGDAANFPLDLPIEGGGTSGLFFVPTTPCRVVDTRTPDGPFGGPEMAGGSQRDFAIQSGQCNVPANAAAYLLNFTVIPDAQLGYLTAWAAGQPRPMVSTLNSDGRVKANTSIVAAGVNGAVSVYATNNTHVVIDISGYFVANTNTSALAFHPITPCRLVDTRQNNTAGLGAPYLHAGQSRSFPVHAGSCSVPPEAQAYSLNFTSVPRGSLGYLTAWPTGQPQPVASILNSLTGTVTANATLTAAGVNGDISVFASNDADLVVDINGYFSPPSTAGGLSLYPIVPCRVLDTRSSSGAAPLLGATALHLPLAGCNIPENAPAYALSTTVVPQGRLGYLTLSANSTTQPAVSTLNAGDGAVTSNLAIVPANTGSIAAFTPNPSHLVLDAIGYFAP